MGRALMNAAASVRQRLLDLTCRDGRVFDSQDINHLVTPLQESSLPALGDKPWR